MKIGMIADSLGALSFDELLDTAAEPGLEQLEFAAGNWSQVPRLALNQMLEPVALARDGRIETRSAQDVAHRVWNYVTLGRSHDELWWRKFRLALVDVGYNDVLSIEHEDLALPPLEGVTRSVARLCGVLGR